jgi:hypothetical protein
MRPLASLVSPFALVSLSLAAAACSESPSSTTSGGAGGLGGAGGAAGMGGAGGAAGGGGAGGSLPTLCDDLGLPAKAWSSGPYGTHRRETADDFEVELFDGTLWRMSEHWTGCEVHVFIPDALPISALDEASIWTKNLDDLIQDSPKNVHYFFVSRQSGDALVASTTAMQELVDTELYYLDPAEQEHWKQHLHVVKDRAGNIDGWLGDAVQSGIGIAGLAIDRAQRIRGVGSLADVDLFSGALQQQMQWPWKSNITYAINEVKFFNHEAVFEADLAARPATVVTLYDGEVLAEFDETEVMLPSAAEMAGFDTLEVDVLQQCPDPEKIEFGNCGAWDYLAYLFVKDEATGENLELARFITTYHREGRWVVDVSSMLPLLASGGPRQFRWEFAPPWNTQPTATKLSLRLSNRGKPVRPVTAIPLWKGGAFGSGYDALHAPIDVAIPASAKKVELYATITGHGAATNQCAEFCNHQHEFSVGSVPHLAEFPWAGNEKECMMDSTEQTLGGGTVPNQWGTWWFGRGGWCPGRHVTPFVWDVTAEAPAGQTTTFSYAGLFGDVTPPDGSGDIALWSWVVVHE